MDTIVLNVSDAIALINQTLDYAYPSIVVEGEVASFKVNQNKYVFFDIKDAQGTLGCFMTVYALRIPIENGMRVRVVAQPRLTQWGKFSLTVRDVQPVGAGSLKRAFDLLHAKLEGEGLFAPARKRALPSMPQRIGVISSTGAAGYTDFITILNQRWGGLDIIVAHTQVQGVGAAAQIVRAIEHFNQMSETPEVLVIVRGGGSADDLSTFNDEPLVRAIAASRVPVMTGIGHEVDTSLSDLAADVRAATPSNAAQILVPDKHEYLRQIDRGCETMMNALVMRSKDIAQRIEQSLQGMMTAIDTRYAQAARRYEDTERYFKQLDPRAVLRRGYSVLRGMDGVIVSRPSPGDEVTIETKDSMITAGVHNVTEK